MGYLHITNLYKDQRILQFKEVYALEKIHGTSAHVEFRDDGLHYFSGGEAADRFLKLFDHEELLRRFRENVEPPCTVYGEAYGGRCQRMSETYGNELRFVAFDVMIGESWLAVPQAVDVVAKLGLEFVAHELIPGTVEAVDATRDAPSVQAERNGCGADKQREGIVLRPPFEVTLNNGERLIAKHKAAGFNEVSTPRKLDEKKLQILEDAEAIALEWVTPMRMDHVLDKLPEATGMEHTGLVIRAMVEDVMRESEGEIGLTTSVQKAAKKAIGAAAAKMWKSRVMKLCQQKAVTT